MQKLVLAALTAVIGCGLVQCRDPCVPYTSALTEIHEMLDYENDNHNYNMYIHGGPSYESRARYILKSLNADLRRARANNYNGYNPNKYNNRQGTAKPDSNCKQLEDAILAKSQEFGIEKIGLESNLVRLRKVLDYQDERNNFHSMQNQECTTKEQKCEEDKTSLEAEISAFNSTRKQLHKTIKSLNDTITKLQNEKKVLLTKLNANAPAIHGATGIEYPVAGRETNSTASFSTTETSIPVPNVTSTEAVEVPESSSVIPDIDLRNDAS